MVYLYGFKNIKELPCFIHTQTVFFFCFNVTNVAFFAIEVAQKYKSDPIQIEPFNANLLATLCSLFVLLIEWVFTEQFLKSVLWLDRRISGINNSFVRDEEPF